MREVVINEDCMALDAYTASITSIKKGSIIRTDCSSPMLGIVKANVIWKDMCINKVLISESLFKNESV